MKIVLRLNYVCKAKCSYKINDTIFMAIKSDKFGYRYKKHKQALSIT
jgi:hypothetical protein